MTQLNHRDQRRQTKRGESTWPSLEVDKDHNYHKSCSILLHNPQCNATQQTNKCNNHHVTKQTPSFEIFVKLTTKYVTYQLKLSRYGRAFFLRSLCLCAKRLFPHVCKGAGDWGHRSGHHPVPLLSPFLPSHAGQSCHQMSGRKKCKSFLKTGAKQKLD